MKKIATILALALAACANGQGEADVTATHSATFPGVSIDAAKLFPPGEITTNAGITFDVSKDMASLSSLGTLTATISKDSISGSDLSLIHHVKATILTQDGKLPPVAFTDVDVQPGSTEVELTALITTERLLQYLAEGPVSFEFEVTGAIPEQPLTVTHTLIAHVDVAMQGSIKL